MVVQLRNGNVEFRFYRPQARTVSVAGDFNDWNQASLPMKMGSDGWWRCQLRVAPGCYHFRYLSDGEWFMDYAAFGLDYGPKGLNSVAWIESPPSVDPVTLTKKGVVDRRRTTPRPGRRMTAALSPNDGSPRARGKQGRLAAGYVS